MEILIGWLSPLRTICMAIDSIAFTLLDDAYNIVMELAGATLYSYGEDFQHMLSNLYILFGIVAFFRLALVLVNSIIDPEKLTEKGKGLGNIFFRVVGMLLILAVTPLIFQYSYEVQKLLVGKENIITGEDNPYGNVILKLFLGDNANVGGANAGKQLRNITLSSLITIDDEYLVNEGAVCTLNDSGQVLDENGTVRFENISEALKSGNDNDKNNDYCGFIPAKCVSIGDGKCQMQGGYVPDTSNDKCDWDNCQNAVASYNEMYVQNDMSPRKLAYYVGVSKDLQVDGSDDEEDVYVYNYMFIVTTIVGVFVTLVILSFAVDLAIRMFELIVLQITAPLFIATFVDPKSAQSGPFKNWLSAVGKSYASLYIRLLILSLMILLITVVNESDIFDNMGSVSTWAKLFVIIGLLIFLKKAPKWISELIGIKSDGLGGLWSPSKLKDNMVGGALAARAASKVGRTAAGTVVGAARRADALRKANKALQRQDKTDAFSRAKNAARAVKESNGSKAKQARAYLGTYFSPKGAKKNLENWGKTAAAGAKGIFSGAVTGAQIGFSGSNMKDVNAKLKADSKNVLDSVGYKSIPQRLVGDKINRASEKALSSVVGSKTARDIRKRNLENKALAEDMFGKELYMDKNGDLFFDSNYSKPVQFDDKSIRKISGDTTTSFRDFVAAKYGGTGAKFLDSSISGQTYVDASGVKHTTAAISAGTLVRSLKDANGNIIYDVNGNAVKEAVIDPATSKAYNEAEATIKNAIETYNKAAADKTGQTGVDVKINGEDFHLSGQGVLEFEASFAKIKNENAERWVELTKRIQEIAKAKADMAAQRASAKSSLQIIVDNTQYAKLEKELSRLTSENDGYNSYLAELKKQLNSANADLNNALTQLSNTTSSEIRSRLEAFISSKRKEVESFNTEARKIEASINANAATIADYNSKMADATVKAEYDEAKANLKSQVQAIDDSISQLNSSADDLNKELETAVSYGSNITTKLGDNVVALTSANSERFIAATQKAAEKMRSAADKFKEENKKDNSGS